MSTVHDGSRKLSALPDIYYFVFRYYEPFLGLAGLLFVCLDPKAVSLPSCRALCFIVLPLSLGPR
jgi:hypothetical protein